MDELMRENAKADQRHKQAEKAMKDAHLKESDAWNKREATLTKDLTAANVKIDSQQEEMGRLNVRNSALESQVKDL